MKENDYAEMCTRCENRTNNVMMCVEVCGVPMDILEEANGKWREKEGNQYDYISALYSDL